MMSEPSATLATIAQSTEPNGSELGAQGVVEIVSVDLQKMLSFYVSLGFRIERRSGSFAVVSGFGVRLFLAENADAPTGKRWANIRILVPDVDLIWDLVGAAGLERSNMIADRPYGLRDFLVADPSGFEIRFAQLLR
jgi:catechol 2,3-dioxygenase-like lactoylglutathione lyase family enzyme